MSQPFHVYVGDIFSSRADVLVLPCSTAGTITTAIERGLRAHRLPLPNFTLFPGEVRFVELDGEHSWKLLAFAASVVGNTSDDRVIRSIGVRLGEFASHQAKYNEYRTFAVPLFGTGAGGLNPGAAAEALFAGFQMAALPDASLRLHILEEADIKIVTEALALLTKNKEQLHVPPATSESGAQPKSRRAVFISYSHKDHKWLERLQVHLRPLERDDSVAVWDDTKIKPGTDWRGEIRKAINSAKVAVLLVSADFLASDFIAKNELPPLLKAAEEEGAVILPVIVRPCRFTKTKSLSGFQAVNDPEKSIGSASSITAEKVLTKVVDAVEHALAGT